MLHNQSLENVVKNLEHVVSTQASKIVDLENAMLDIATTKSEMQEKVNVVNDVCTNMGKAVDVIKEDLASLKCGNVQDGGLSNVSQVAHVEGNWARVVSHGCDTNGTSRLAPIVCGKLSSNVDVGEWQERMKRSKNLVI